MILESMGKDEVDFDGFVKVTIENVSKMEQKIKVIAMLRAYRS